MVAGSEHDCVEAQHIAGRERGTRREPDFDFSAGLQVKARQAGRQRRGIVRNHDVAGLQQLDE